MKGGVSKSLNQYLNIQTYYKSVGLKQDGRVWFTSVARLVYYNFVEPFDINDDSLIVSYKDFDGRNLKPCNLILCKRSELNIRSYLNDRCLPIGEKNKLPILQLTMQNKVVQQYSSITEASEMTGCNLGAIATCIKGTIFQHKGFKWKVLNESEKTAEKENAHTFNQYLYDAIGNQQLSIVDPLPVLNLSTKDLAGEIWKPILEWENAYMISNFGRIKSIGRFKENRVWLKEHILKLVPMEKSRSKRAVYWCH